MNGIIGKKLGMTSIFNEGGKRLACTVVEAGPCVVTQVKTKDTDGYEAVQLSWGEKKDKHTSSAMKGHFTKSNTTPKRVVMEFRDVESTPELGSIIDVSLFEAGEFVSVVGKAKGKGFQGVVKRHGFAGVGEATHGQQSNFSSAATWYLLSHPSMCPSLAELVQVWLSCKESQLNFLSATKFRQKLCLSLPDFMAR